MTAAPLKSPFPWFGGKSRASHLVWAAFGDLPNYVEPFAGSLAVLLARPTAARIETVNDLDCYLANFWRAVKSAPEQVAEHADWPFNEADLHARHRWLVGRAEFREKMRSDPDFFDPKIAGWWVWGISQWLGSGWCRSSEPRPQLPNFSSSAGLQNRAVGPAERLSWLRGLQARLAQARVACGDWERIVSGSLIGFSGRGNPQMPIPCGIFLDPPYGIGADGLYAEEENGVADRVREWAVAHGDDSRLRIALCGYEGQHSMPPSWICVAWRAHGGYGSQRKDGSNANHDRERIWFSPHCEVVKRQRGLFDSLEVA